MEKTLNKLRLNVRSLLGLVSYRPFDTSNADGRSKERFRRAFLTSASAIIARVVSMAGPLITVPLALGYLGAERYGLWMTVMAMVGMFAFADLGLGNGLMTELSQADGRGDIQESRRCISSCLFSLTGTSLILLCLYLLAFPFIPWPRVFNTSSPDLLSESGAVVTVCFLMFLVNLPLAVVQRVQWGLQEGFRSHLWQCVGSAINVVVVLTAVKARMGLPVLVLCVTGVQPLVNLLNGFAFFIFQRPQLRPRLQDFHWTTARRLLGTGFWFFLVSIVMVIGVYSDNVVVAQVLGLSTVPLYSIPASLASYLGTVASMLYTPFWSANGEALARGEVDWVRCATKRLVKINAVITGSAGLAFVLVGPIFLHMWIGPGFSPARSVFAGLAGWAFLTSVAGPLFMILNGANSVRVQFLIFAIFALISIVLKVVLTNWIGIAGVVWASVVPYACLVMPATLLATRKVLQRAEQKAVNASEDIDLTVSTCKQPIQSA